MIKHWYEWDAVDMSYFSAPSVMDAVSLFDRSQNTAESSLSVTMAAGETAPVVPMDQIIAQFGPAPVHTDMSMDQIISQFGPAPTHVDMSMDQIIAQFGPTHSTNQ